MWERSPSPVEPCAKCGEKHGMRTRRLCRRCYDTEKDAGRLDVWCRVAGSLRCSKCEGARAPSQRCPETTLCHRCRRDKEAKQATRSQPRVVAKLRAEFPDWLAMWPTKATGRSSAKIKVFAARAERRMPLFHPGDAETRLIIRNLRVFIAEGRP